MILVPGKTSGLFKCTWEMHSEKKKKKAQKYMKLGYTQNRLPWFPWNINSHIQQFSLTWHVISTLFSIANQTAVPNLLTFLSHLTTYPPQYPAGRSTHLLLQLSTLLQNWTHKIASSTRNNHAVISLMK